MRKVDYVTLIKESLSELKLLEQQQSKARLRRRVQLLRLLKSKTVSTIKQASAILGISAKHAYHLWHRYRAQGLVAFLQLNYQAKAAKLKPEEQEKRLQKNPEPILSIPLFYMVESGWAKPILPRRSGMRSRGPIPIRWYYM